MTPKLPDAVAEESLQLVRESVEELQTERAAFERLVSETFDGLDALRDNLQSHQEALTEKQVALESRESQIHEALEQLEVQAAQGADYEKQIEKLEQEMNQLKKERNAARKKLDAATEELASMAGVLELVEATEEELQETKAKLEKVRGELSARGDSSEREELKKLKKTCAELEQQLVDSRTEVEHLTQKSREQEDELKSYRKKWLGELQGMKKALKRRSAGTSDWAEDDSDDKASAAAELPPGDKSQPAPATDEVLETERDVSSEPCETKSTVEAANVPRESSDPVIGSVLSELAKLEEATKE